MKLFPLFIAAVAGLTLCACSEKDTNTKEITATAAETTVVQTEAETTATEESLPDDDFSVLPDEAVADFDYVSKMAAQLFPDAAGKKMYGYKGTQEISTDNGVCSCYIFDFYTYKSKLYNKIATIAKDINSSAVFVLDDDCGTYTTANISAEEQPQSEWFVSDSE